MTIQAAQFVDDLPSAPAGAPGTAFQSLLYTVFQRPREANATGLVIALTSATPGEGVSHITKTLVAELAKCEFNSVARVDARSLRRLYEPTAEMLHRSVLRPANNVCELQVADDARLSLGDGRWDGSWQYRRDCINLLRREFDYALIDCSSMKESGDVLSIAPLVDGVILVIEANRTRREQVQHAERSIEAAQGKILGHILNKRTYDIPDWLYRRM